MDYTGTHVTGGGHWEDCGPDCPGIVLPAVNVGPGNAAGGSCGESRVLFTLIPSLRDGQRRKGDDQNY